MNRNISMKAAIALETISLRAELLKIGDARMTPHEHMTLAEYNSSIDHALQTVSEEDYRLLTSALGHEPAQLMRDFPVAAAAATKPVQPNGDGKSRFLDMGKLTSLFAKLGKGVFGVPAELREEYLQRRQATK